MPQLYAPNGRKITGTCDTIPLCNARIAGATIGESGIFELKYDGGTDVNWDGQTTDLNAAGERQFLDEDGTIWSEGQLVLRDDDADAEQ